MEGRREDRREAPSETQWPPIAQSLWHTGPRFREVWQIPSTLLQALQETGMCGGPQGRQGASSERLMGLASHSGGGQDAPGSRHTGSKSEALQHCCFSLYWEIGRQPGMMPFDNEQGSQTRKRWHLKTTRNLHRCWSEKKNSTHAPVLSLYGWIRIPQMDCASSNTPLSKIISMDRAPHTIPAQGPTNTRSSPTYKHHPKENWVSTRIQTTL